MYEIESEKDLRKWLKNVQNDKITKILLKNSNLTDIQFETFLIDIVSRNNDENQKKNKFRLKKDNISRGSFNHTRKQALNNIIRSIYTILLLGYYGVLETPQLEPFIDGSNRLKSYIDATQDKEADLENLNLLTEILKNELIELASRKTYYE